MVINCSCAISNYFGIGIKEIFKHIIDTSMCYLLRNVWLLHNLQVVTIRAFDKHFVLLFAVQWVYSLSWCFCGSL